MKAAQIESYGDVTNIQVRDTDKPQPGSGQLLVKVTGASLNPFDLTVLSGGAQEMAPLAFPATLGLDLAGTVEEIGADVTGFAVGDRVFGTANAMFGASGAFAEYAAVNAGSVGHSPANITDSEAASLPTAGISALQALNTLAIKDGMKLFIQGGAGGIGSIAIQIAKSRGAYVAATASTENVDFVKSLGADEVIDYKTQQYTDVVSGYDAVLTTAYSDDMNDILTVLKNGGTAVSMVGPFDEERAKELQVSTSAQMTHVTTASLESLAELVDSGMVRPLLDKSFSLDQIQDAYNTLANGSNKGKIAISLG